MCHIITFILCKTLTHSFSPSFPEHVLLAECLKHKQIKTPVVQAGEKPVRVQNLKPIIVS